MFFKKKEPDIYDLELEKIDLMYKYNPEKLSEMKREVYRKKHEAYIQSIKDKLRSKT